MRYCPLWSLKLHHSFVFRRIGGLREEDVYKVSLTLELHHDFILKRCIRWLRDEGVYKVSLTSTPKHVGLLDVSKHLCSKVPRPFRGSNLLEVREFSGSRLFILTRASDYIVYCISLLTVLVDIFDTN